MTCGKQGTWEGNGPRCDIVNCTRPADVKDGSFISIGPKVRRYLCVNSVREPVAIIRNMNCNDKATIHFDISFQFIGNPFSESVSISNSC